MYEVPGPGTGDSRVFSTGDGYFYHGNRITHYGNAKRFHLRCTEYRRDNCEGTAVILEDGEVRSWANKKPHTCTPDRGGRDERILRREVLELCRTGRYESPRPLLNRIAARYPITAAARVRLRAFRWSMRRARNSQFPLIPHTLAGLGDLLASQEYQHLSSTLNGNDNLYSATVGGPGERRLVFISQRMKQYLPTVKEVYADGTFASTPALPVAQQIYQIVGVVSGHIIPLVVVLMERRTFNAYRAILLHLQEVAPGFRPEKVHCDFEKQEQRAWAVVYRTKVIGCYVHFCRAVLKTSGQLGLKRLMNSNNEVNRIVRAMLSIPLLPCQLMRRGFRVLIQWAVRKHLLFQLLELIVYFIRTWLKD